MGVWKEYVDHSVWLYLRARYGRHYRWYWLNYETTGEILI
jgi:hypothetical protein